MAIENARGDVYFIRESDVISKDETNYVKIGIVKDQGNERLEDRVKEHQTGNPRSLFLYGSVKTDCVHRVETMLHRKYAMMRISGEWFHFTAVQLSDAIKECEAISRVAGNNIQAVNVASELGKVASNGQILNPTAELKKWHKEYLEAEVVLSECSEIDKKLRVLIEDAKENQEDISGVAATQNREIKGKFDEVLFKSENEALWGEFVVQEVSIDGRFIIEGKKTFDGQLSDICPELVELSDRFKEMAVLVSSKNMSIDEIQKVNLEVIGIGAQFEWQQDIAEANIKALCGKYDAVADICKWKRVEKVKSKLNKKELEKAHPVMIEKYSGPVTTITATVIKKGKGGLGG